MPSTVEKGRMGIPRLTPAADAYCSGAWLSVHDETVRILGNFRADSRLESNVLIRVTCAGLLPGKQLESWPQPCIGRISGVKIVNGTENAPESWSG